MKLHVALLLSVLCLALPAYGRGAQDKDLLKKQTNQLVTRVDELNRRAATYLDSGECKKAVPLLEQAIEISKQHNYPAGHAEALLLLSDCQNRTNHAQAVKTAHEALALWKTIGEPRGIIRSHLSIATYEFAQNSLGVAAWNYETARSLANQSGFRDLEAEALIYLGFIGARKGAWQEVIKFLWYAGKLVDADSDPEKMMQMSTTIAEAYVETGWQETALEKYKEALEYAKKTKDPRNVAVVTWGIGRILYFSGKYPEALKTLEEALRQSIPLDQPAVKAMCHEFLGRTYEALGEHTLALDYLESAIELYSKAINPMEVARTRGLIGQVHEKSGRFEEARQFYRQALDTFDRHSDQVNQSATLFALGRLEMKSGNYELAESYLKRCIYITENMRRMSTNRDLTAAFSATVHDRYQQYIQCLMRNHRDPAAMQRVVLAFEMSESARARSLLELLRVSDTNLLSSVDPELSKKERDLRQSLHVKEDDKVTLLSKPEYEKQELEKLDAELERLKADYKNVLATIKERYPAYEQITEPQSWDLRRIQEEVIGDDDTLLLEYVLGPDKSYVWAVTRNGITSRDLPSQGVITEAVKKVYALLSKRPQPDTKNALDHATREVAQMILSPITDQLTKRRILVAADGALNYIPFRILPIGESAEPLVAQHEIINVPSASILGELRKEASQRGVRKKVLAAFGDPVFAEQKQPVQPASTRDMEIIGDSVDPGSLGRLFHAAREIAYLCEVASEEQTFAATESKATRDQLLNMDLSQYAILHFATHGVLRPSSPEDSGLWLSTINEEGKTVEGFVGLQDIYSLRAPVDLVVLSACQTGLGKDVRGEGLIGLTRGFMYAGATSVVASLWAVDDEATAELMKHFYTEMLKNGKTPAEALRLAQNSIRQNPQWSAPHYWAGFTLQGEYRYVVNSSRGWQVYQIVLLSIAGVLLIGAVCAFWCRRKATRH